MDMNLGKLWETVKDTGPWCRENWLESQMEFKNPNTRISRKTVIWLELKVWSNKKMTIIPDMSFTFYS